MIAEFYSLANVLERKRGDPVIPDKIRKIAESVAKLGIPVPYWFTHFHLRQVGSGVEVWVNDYGTDRGGYNLSALLHVYPSNFEAARIWAAAWGMENGHDLVEVKRA